MINTKAHNVNSLTMSLSLNIYLSRTCSIKKILQPKVNKSIIDINEHGFKKETKSQ